MILQVSNLKFSYPQAPVLKEITFAAGKGDLVAILGTNGAGKTTLLKTLNRILKYQAGNIYIQGQDIRNLSKKKLAQIIGYVPQSSQFADITVFDAILLGRRPYIIWEATRQDLEVVEHALDELELNDFALRPVTQLSGGETQKVTIARILAQEPQVLLFDEPTSNLDIKNQIDVMKTIEQIVSGKQVTAIVTMHDLNLAVRFANKFIMLKEGKIFAAGGKEILTSSNIRHVYGISAAIINHNGVPVIIPMDEPTVRQ